MLVNDSISESVMSDTRKSGLEYLLFIMPMHF